MKGQSWLRFLHCCRDAMVAWISQRLVPDVQNVTTINEAKKIITGRGGVAVLAFLDSLSVHSNHSNAIAQRANVGCGHVT